MRRHQVVGMAQIGHFGTPALVAGIAAVVLLVLHLAVPFGILTYGEETGLDSETLSRGDIADGFNGPVDYGPASVGLTLTGIILAMVAGIVLFVVGMLPVPVVAARFAGWFLGVLGALGAFMALSSSAYWLGTGFSALLSAIAASFQDTPNAGRLWVISPVIVFIGASVAFLAFLKVMTNVVAVREGLRDRANHAARGVVLAAVVLSAMLIVPWSMLILDGEDRRATEAAMCPGSDTCQAATYFYTAFGHGSDPTASQGLGAPYGGILGIAERTSDQGSSAELFQGLAFSIKVLTAMGWIGVILGMLTTFGHVLSSAFKLPGAARFSPVLLMLNVPMLLWGTIMFLLASIYMWTPSYDDAAFYGGALVSDQSWWYGFLPLVVAVPLAMWAFNQYQSAREVFGQFGGTVTVVREEANFD